LLEDSRTESELRKDLVEACRFLYAANAAGDGTAGHLSVRLDRTRILIKPTHVSWHWLEPKDLASIDFQGQRIDCETEGRTPVREWPIHSRIYASRPDVKCVLHAHPSSSTLMAALNISVEPINQDCSLFVDQLPVLDNAGVSVCTSELGDTVARALGSVNALLLKHHGSVVVGAEIRDVCVRAQKLEKVAETMLRAASAAALPIMTESAKREVIQARVALSPSRSLSADENKWEILRNYYLPR
jgi:ribulose-5-phosphate 4-epimerase/fuculose-1-phosphate aldolase